MTSTSVRVALAGALSSLLLATPAVAADSSPEIIVQRAPGVSVAAAADARQDAGVKVVQANFIDHADLVVAKDGDQVAAIRELEADPTVLSAEPNRRVYGAQTTTGQTADALFGSLWGITRIGAPAAWDYAKGAGVTVAVVDSGVQLNHPDLSVAQNTADIPGNSIDDDFDGYVDDTNGWDWVQDDNDPSDVYGHGTHISGTISANENTIGVVGVAPQADVISYRVLDNYNSGLTSDVAAAFDLAGRKGYKIVNASLSSSGFSTVEQDVIASHPNTLYVVAASNDSTDNDAVGRYPCNYTLPNIICVQAIQYGDTLASYSNWGKTTVDIAAPGTSILSTIPGSTYAAWNGTSMATPHVAGVAALLWSYDPSLTVAQVKQLILDNAQPLPGFANLSVTGGLLDADAVLAAAAGDPPPPPPTPPAKPDSLTATAHGSQIDLAWSPVADAASYRIYRWADRGPWNLVATVQSDKTTYSDVGLAANTTYSYKVSAVDGDDEEGDTSPVAWDTTAALSVTPAPPTSNNGGGGGGSTPPKPAPQAEQPAAPQPAPVIAPAPVVPPSPTTPATPTVTDEPKDEPISDVKLNSKGILRLSGVISALPDGRRVRVTLTANVRGRKITRSVLVHTQDGKFAVKLRVPARMRGASRIKVTVKAGKHAGTVTVRR